MPGSCNNLGAPFQVGARRYTPELRELLATYSVPRAFWGAYAGASVFAGLVLGPALPKGLVVCRSLKLTEAAKKRL